MLFYSLLFALAYVLCALVVGWLLLTFARSPGPLSFLSHFIVVVAALIPGWAFARRQRRHFTPQERRRLVALCISWVFLVEGLSLASRPDLLALPLPALAGVLAFGLGVDALLVWVSFRYVVRALVPHRAASAHLLITAHTSPAHNVAAMLTPLLVLAMLAATVGVLRSGGVNTTRVTVADIPHVLQKVASSTRSPAFAVFVFSTPGRPDPRDAVNLQFSQENGRAGFDWVLSGRRNIEDERSFIVFAQRRGFSFTERTGDGGVRYLRFEEGNLTQLCTEVITEFYAHPRSEPMELIFAGFQWDRSAVAQLRTGLEARRRAARIVSGPACGRSEGFRGRPASYRRENRCAAS